ncbi:MAG: hypothetical protein QXV63_02045, partial [Candidatus Aenigmatarchaeota archaeon]
MYVRFIFFLLISLSILVFHITFSYCPLQSHPLSEICPIDTNLNMFGFNITNVGVVSAGKIFATSLCIGNDCISSWSQISSDAINPWSNNSIWIFIRDGYPLNVNISNILFVNATTGNVGIGTTSPVRRLDVVGDINATQAIYSGQGYYVGTTQIITSGRVLQNIASVGTHLVPSSDNAFDLGNSTNRWRAVYANSYFVGNTQIITSGRVLQNIASVGTHLVPSSDNAFDLGNSTNRWRAVYANSYFVG